MLLLPKDSVQVSETELWGRCAAVNLAFIWRNWMGFKSSTDGVSIPTSFEENVFLI